MFIWHSEEHNFKKPTHDQVRDAASHQNGWVFGKGCHGSILASIAMLAEKSHPPLSFPTRWSLSHQSCLDCCGDHLVTPSPYMSHSHTIPYKSHQPDRYQETWHCNVLPSIVKFSQRLTLLFNVLLNVLFRCLMLLLIAPSVNNVITGEYQVTVQTSCCDQTRIGRLYRRLRNGCSLH